MFNAVIFAGILATSFLFAMLGLGGGMVYVPILKWAGLDFKDVVIPLGLLLNGLNTLLALIPYHKAKLVDYKGAWPMGLTAMLLAPVGALTTQFVPKDTLVILFALMMVAAAFKVLWDVLKPKKEQMVAAAGRQAGSPGTSGAAELAVAGSEGSARLSLHSRMVWGAGAGGIIGFIGGLLGVGGGFIIGPVLMTMGYPAKQAAATTAFVVTFSSFSGYLGHMAGREAFNWLTVLLITAVVIGSQVGANFMAKKAKPIWVKTVYGVVLLLIAVKLVLDVI